MKSNFLKSVLIVFLGSLFCDLSGQTVTYPQDENSLRLMSYNVRNARGMDEKVDYERVADVIRKVSPDVVALQELDSVTTRSENVDVLAVLGDLTKMYHVYSASIDYRGGKYGVGILSKEKPLSWRRIPLPGREEARSLLIVEFEKYVYCCTHFSLNKEDRLASVKIITEEAKSYNKPVFIAGDFNGKPGSPEILEMQNSCQVLSNVKTPTFPSDKPRETIDYIFVYKQGEKTYTVLREKVLDEPLASDHLPLFVDVRMSGEK